MHAALRACRDAGGAGGGKRGAAEGLQGLDADVDEEIFWVDNSTGTIRVPAYAKQFSGMQKHSHEQEDAAEHGRAGGAAGGDAGHGLGPGAAGAAAAAPDKPVVGPGGAAPGEARQVEEHPSAVPNDKVASALMVLDSGLQVSWCAGGHVRTSLHMRGALTHSSA